MLIYRFFKYTLLLFIVFSFSACAHKSISKEELSKNSYLENKPCYKQKDSSTCIIQSRISEINTKKIEAYTKDDKEYYLLNEGLNKITIETDFINIPYTYETNLEIEVSKNNIYTLKYKINSKDNRSVDIKYLIFDGEKLIKEVGPKFKFKKDENSTMKDIKDYSKMGLSGMLILLRTAANAVILF